jgi:prepilin-type N-terminal cleavage/methylation domain-containing protein
MEGKMLKKVKGFTLIELIIVIVIIGILAAITIIGYSNQANKARRASVRTAMADAINAAAACTAEGTGTVSAPTANVGGNQICSVTTTVNGNWPNVQTIGATTYTMTSVVPTTATGPVVTSGSDTLACTLNGCIASANWTL